MMITIKNYINGQLTDPVNGRYLQDIDPATGHSYALVPDSDSDDVELAVRAAQDAFPKWSRTPTDERARLMMALADRLESEQGRFARAECIDNGKPLKLASSLDIPRSIKNLRFFAAAATQFRSESYPMDGVGLNYTLRQPRGVAGIISPWNLPLYLLTWKIAPALVTGNTVIAKPSEITPMTAYLFSELCQEMSFPPGVLNIVHGTGPSAGAAITSHPRVPTISFTGGTLTGRAIAESAAPMFKKVSLEMGGKNPNIIFADADMDAVIEGSLRASFANQGQVCLCGSRMFVEQSIYDEFVDRFVARTRQLRVDDPLKETADQGALVSKTQLDKVEYYVNLAKEDGGQIRCGGCRPERISERCADGYFYSPTVITGLNPQCRVNQEEIFGPVVSVMPFAGDEEVVASANATDYGLSASVWTGDITRAHNMAERIQCGTVWVNGWMIRDLRVPFGGMKNSGVGREGGEEALRFYTEAKNVCIHLPG